MSEQPARYQRSASGMVGAILVLLLIIGAFVGARALNRDELAVEPAGVDYREVVGFAQADGWTVVYPESVPDEWRATSVDSASEQAWGIGFLSPEGFVGVRQSGASADELLTTYVDEDVEPSGSVAVDSSISRTWRAYRDAGGDLGYLATLDGRRVLVYGSAPATHLQRLAESLTTAPVR